MRMQRSSDSLKKPKKKPVIVDKVHYLDDNEFIAEIIKREEQAEEE